MRAVTVEQSSMWSMAQHIALCAVFGSETFFWLHFIRHSAVVKQRMKTVCSVHLHCLKLNGH